MNLKEAIEKTSLNRKTILEAIKKGMVQAEMIAGKGRSAGRSSYNIDEASLEIWVKQRALGRQVKEVSLELPIYLIEKIDKYREEHNLTKHDVFVRALENLLGK